MENEESVHRAVAPMTGDQDDSGVKRAREEDAEVKRLTREIEAKGKKIEEVGEKAVAMGEAIARMGEAIARMGEAIARDVTTLRGQRKTEEEIAKHFAEQKSQQGKIETILADVKTQQVELKSQQDELKTQQAKLEAERDRLMQPPLQNTPPPLPALLAQFGPETSLYKLGDVKPIRDPLDLRFYPVTRPAAEEIKAKIEACPPQERATMLLTAVSGSGKTSSMFATLSKYFGIYLLCTPRASEKRKSLLKNEFNKCFAVFDDTVTMAVVLSKIHATTFEKTQEAVRLSTALIASHLVMLWVFLTQFLDANPYQSLVFQLSVEGVDVVTKIFTFLKGFTTEALEELCRSLRVPLDTAIATRKAPPHLVVALDEIEAAAGALTDVFDSRTGHHGQSLLSPVVRAVSDLAGTTKYHQLYGGTGSNEARSVSLTSDIGKDWGGGRIRGGAFPVAKEEDVVAILGKVTGLTKEAVIATENVKAYLVNARFRLTTLAADSFREDGTGDDAESRLARAVKVSIAKHKESLEDSIKLRVAGGTSDAEKSKNLSKLHRVYVAAMVTGGEMPFADPELDLCQVGVAGVDANGVFHVTELFALDTIKEFFKKENEIGIAAVVRESLNDLETLVKKYGGNATGKGNLFESLVMNCLRRFSGMKVVDLPIIQGLNPPASLRSSAAWKNIVFKCTVVSSLEGCSDASEFLTKNPGVFLLPEAVHRADGLLTLGSDALVEVGCKLYSGTVPSDDVRSQFVSTSPASAYERADAYLVPSFAPGASERLNRSALHKRAEWEKKGFHRRRALRIHVTLPAGAEHRDSPDHVWKPGVYLVGSDIVVNLDKTNIQWLFAPAARSSGRRTWGGGGGGAQPQPIAPEVRAALWRVLKGITGASEFNM